MRTTFSAILPALGMAALLVACGSSGSSSSSSNSSSSSPSTSSVSAGGSASASLNAADLVLATSDLPSGDGTWSQHSDSTLSGVAGTRQRAWNNSQGGQGLEVDVAVEGSSSQAETDWGTWKSTVGGKVSSTDSTSCPSGAPSNCIEVVGTWKSDSTKNAVVLAWQQSNVLAAVVLLTGTGAAQQSYAESVAQAEGQLISTKAGS